MTIILSWSLILLLILVSSHIDSNELSKLNDGIKEALYERATVDVEDEDETYLDVKTYRGIGMRRTWLGFASIVILLWGFTEPPFYDFTSNVIMYVLNGLCISSLILYMIEGGFMWNASIKASLMSEEGQEEE